jgi:hydroxyacyl-ACP dehydratase HTD2-like protein with hotdog domain
LFVSGDLFNNRLFIGGDVLFNNRLFVGGDVSFNNRLFVGGDVSFNNRLFVGGDVSFNNRLFVGGDVSFNKRFFVGGDVSFNNRLFANDISINGNLTIVNSCTAQLFTATSDYRIKNSIKDLNESFVVDNIRPIEYTNTFLNKKDMGVLAHELQEIYPCLVTGEKDGEKFQTVNYNGIIALLINEVKNLKKELKLIKSDFEILKLREPTVPLKPLP